MSTYRTNNGWRISISRKSMNEAILNHGKETIQRHQRQHKYRHEHIDV